MVDRIVRKFKLKVRLMKKPLILALLGLSLILCGAIYTQDEDKKPVEFTETYDARYVKQKPNIGETIDGLEAFDEHGNALDFKDLRGKYTVFNFGCLT